MATLLVKVIDSDLVESLEGLKELESVIDSRYQVVSSEGVVDTLREQVFNLIPKLSNILVLFQGAINSILKFKIERKVTDNFIKNHPRVFKRVIEARYTLLVNTEAHIVPHLSGTYKDYVDVLNQMTNLCIGIEERLLEFNKEVAMLAGDRTKQLNNREKRINQFVKLASERESLKSQLQSIFRSKTNTESVPYSAVVKRQKDLDYTYQTLLSVGEQLRKINSPSLKQTLEKLYTNLDLLKNSINENEITNPDKSLFQYISKGSLELASELELFSLTYYQYEMLATALDKTVSNCKETLDNKDKAFEATMEAYAEGDLFD